MKVKSTEHHHRGVADCGNISNEEAKQIFNEIKTIIENRTAIPY